MSEPKIIKKEFDRKCPVNTYLKTTTLSDPLKVMMRQIYKGHSKTLEEWKKEDEKVNKRRCN